MHRQTTYAKALYIFTVELCTNLIVSQTDVYLMYIKCTLNFYNNNN